MNSTPDHDRDIRLGHPVESAGEILHELEEEGIKRPSWWKQAIPWAITGAILWWVFKDIDFREFVSRLRDANLSILLPAMIGFVVVFAIGDIFSFGLSYRWFITPELSNREIIHVRWGTYLVQSLYAPLHGVFLFAYLMRRKGAPFLWILSAGGLVAFCDQFVLNAAWTATLMANTIWQFVPEIESFWLGFFGISWALWFVHFRYWFTDSKDRYLLRFSNSPIMRSPRHARPRHYYTFWTARSAIFAAGVIAHYLALRSFGIEVPITIVLIVGPLVTGSAFLPISGGGFGGPQLVALLLLPYVDGDKEWITAYSVAFSACFTLGRSMIGAAFMPGYLKDLKVKAPKMTVDPITGESLGNN